MCLEQNWPEVVMIDLWHPNYNSYMIIVGIYHNILSVETYNDCLSRRLAMFLKSVSQIQEKESHAHWSITFTEHQAAVTRVCGLLFLVQISCWTPYSVLCLWTTILPPETLNVYFTLIPSIACKVSRIIIWLKFTKYTCILSLAITNTECHGRLVESSKVSSFDLLY